MFDLTPAQYAATVEKIAKINTRARRRGFTGRLEVTGHQVVTVNVGDPLPFPNLPMFAEVVHYETTITGEAPCYEGWRFLAALDELPTEDDRTEWIVRCAPGVTDESVDRRTLRPGACDHCGTCRPNRRKIYLVQHVASGEYRQVGATCIKDFLGWQGMPVFLSPRDLLDADDVAGFGGPVGRDWASTPRYVVIVALAAVEAFGWVSRARCELDPRAVSTSERMLPYLTGSTHRDDVAVITRIQEHIAAAESRADEVIATVLAEFADAAHGYEANLRAALSASHLEVGQFGLVASIVPAYERIVSKRVEQAEREAFEPVYLGAVGDKVEFTGVITTAMTVDGYAYRSTQRLIVVRTDVALVKFCSTAAWTYDVGAGDRVTITATIKRLDVWREHQQTVIVRPKLVNHTPAQDMAIAS